MTENGGASQMTNESRKLENIGCFIICLLIFTGIVLGVLTLIEVFY